MLNITFGILSSLITFMVLILVGTIFAGLAFGGGRAGVRPRKK